MKRIIMLLVLLALLTVLAACGGDSFEKAIIGRWEGTSTTNDQTQTATWEFFEDGTVIITVTGPLGAADSFAGLYEFEDTDTILLLEEEGDSEPGRRDLRMPDADTLILTAPVSGARAVLKRVEV